MQPEVKYRIYPSLLDQFQNLLDYELVADEAWNKVSGKGIREGRYDCDKEVGDYVLTPDEMYYKIEADLIDSINRIDGEYSEAADKGTVFNEIIDCIIEHRNTNIQGCRLKSGNGCIFASYHDFNFVFDAQFCKDFASMFKGSLTQYRCEANMLTKYGNVLLYGYIDEWVKDRVIDIKTTSYYNFGKFERKWQRHLYPYCVIESGMIDNISSFEYAVVQFPKYASVYYGTYYKEEYTYNHEDSSKRLKMHVEAFIEWLESRREYITNKTIFGESMPEGYVGTPININLLKQAS